MTEPILTIEQTKLWCRIDADVDDLVVQALIEDATLLIETRLRRPVISTDDENAVCTSIDTVPASIKLAALGVISMKYENRQATNQQVWDMIGTNVGLDQYIDWSK